MHGHIPRKRFGQNFLVDQYIIGFIVDAIAPKPHQRLVEIGPGLGALTHALRPHLPQGLTVIELDRDLVAYWQKQTHIHTIASDVLKVDFAALQTERSELPKLPLRVVGNLPYNISSPILFHLMQWAELIADQHFMLQREVVDRMVAMPGTSAYGRLSVMLQWRYQMNKVLDVPPEAFDPPPKVQSAVVRMIPKASADLAKVTFESLESLMRVAFSQRRKLLRHSLGRWLEEKMISHSFDLQRRAEEVPVHEYVALARQMPI